MKFYRIYIEMTNVCGLACSFCPTKSLPSLQMTLPFFESVIAQASSYTGEIACHVMGDPLTHPNLKSYLNIIDQYGLKAVLTTSGYFLKKHGDDTLFHPAVKQINISLNSYNKNDTVLTFEQYLAPIVDLCHRKIECQASCFINLRVWNLDESMSEYSFNEMLFGRLSAAFDISLDTEQIYMHHPRSIRLAEKVLLHFDSYFEWPSLENPLYGDGTCQGLSSHIAVLADGRVVPCCLDGDGIMTLGSLHTHSLDEILHSERTVAIVKGFKEGKAVEELCQRCSYKDRFNK
jgi:radical SAM protein with 4Fe4S-binding SPASM domain